MMVELMRTFTAFRKRLLEFYSYRQAMRDIHTRFADATPEELVQTDRVCIICRDEMFDAKKMPCGHFFHLHCVRTWIERQQTCPTCRSSLLSSTSPQQPPEPSPRPPQQQPQQQPTNPDNTINNNTNSSGSNTRGWQHPTGGDPTNTIPGSHQYGTINPTDDDNIRTGQVPSFNTFNPYGPPVVFPVNQMGGQLHPGSMPYMGSRFVPPSGYASPLNFPFPQPRPERNQNQTESFGSNPMMNAVMTNPENGFQLFW